MRPIEAYNAQVELGALTRDPDQAAAMQALQGLYDELVTVPEKSFFSFLKKVEIFCSKGLSSISKLETSLIFFWIIIFFNFFK